MCVASLSSSVGVPAFGATTPRATISHTQMLIRRLSARLAREQALSETLDQERDKDVNTLDGLRASITHEEAISLLKQHDLDVTSNTMVRDALRTYVDGASEGQQIELLNLNVANGDATQMYEQEALGNLEEIQNKLVRERHQLHHIVVVETHERNVASAEVHQIRVITLKNQADAAQTASILHQMTHNLITEVISYEIAAGVAAARAGNTQGVENAYSAAEAVGGSAAGNEVISAIDAAVPPKPQTVSGTPAGTAAGDAAVAAAESQIGVPYVWGGESPGSGFDCSGLTQWSWGRAGVYIPRTAAEQWDATTHVPLTDLRPGDLLFYYNLDGDDQVDHVVMYVGSGPYGTQTIIAAAHTGTNVGFEPMFTYGLIGAGRP